jgi:hypothetical protein
MEIWRILNGFSVFNVNLKDFNYFENIYSYLMGRRRNLNCFLEMYVFLQVFMENLRILNGFTAFNGNMKNF